MDSKRKQDIALFYSIIRDLRDRQGLRRLSECDGKMCWPRRGVYFFFEDGELRENGVEMRVVRVGTHAVSEGSRTRLWDRLRGHKGTNAGGGNHRGSIFRLHVGSALIRKRSLDYLTWGKGSSAKKEIRNLESPLEYEVSQKIETMPFAWIDADDPPGPGSIRAYIERNAIALLSNFNKKAIDPPPSRDWLGLYADRKVIGLSGLWNVNHVESAYDPAFLDVFGALAQRSSIK